jgi:hypothetical protein
MHAGQYYDLMLDACERLFDNEIEISAFEDEIRLMFGPKVRFSTFESKWETYMHDSGRVSDIHR